jgi:hypothetical protein
MLNINKSCGKKDIKFLPKISVHQNIFTCLIPYLYNYSTQQNPSWETNPSSASEEIPRIFMASYGSLSYSQLPATCPNPESARPSPCYYIPLPEDQFQYSPLIYAWVFQVIPFQQVSPPNPSSPYVLQVPPTSFSSIWSHEKFGEEYRSWSCSLRQNIKINITQSPT